MTQRNGFKNIQVQAKQDLYNLFNDTYEQSGLNSKAEFLSSLIDGYLNPEESNSQDLRKAEKSLEAALNENDQLISRIALYETDELKEVLNKHKGEKLVFKNSQGKNTTIVIHDLPDVFSAIFQSVKID